MSARRRRPGLIAVWGLLVLLIGSIAVLEGPGLMRPATNEPTEAALFFGFIEPDLGGVQVVYKRQISSLMRGPDGLWYQHDDSHGHGGVAGGAAANGNDDRHVPDPAQSAAISERLARAVGIRANRRASDADDIKAVGLTRSETMVAFYGRASEGVDFSKPLAVLYIGDPDPGHQGYYVKLDADPSIALLPEADIDDLLELVLANQPTKALPE